MFDASDGEPRTSQARTSTLCQEKDPKDPRLELVTEVEWIQVIDVVQ